MKASELRIGNLVVRKFYNPDRIDLSHTVENNDFYWYEESGCDDEYWDNFTPIPLTEEWLLKFGWVWNEETNSYEKYPNGDARMHLQFRDVSNSYSMFNYVLKALIADRIWYVHQLQNLYFALTGNELNIK